MLSAERSVLCRLLASIYYANQMGVKQYRQESKMAGQRATQFGPKLSLHAIVVVVGMGDSRRLPSRNSKELGSMVQCPVRSRDI